MYGSPQPTNIKSSQGSEMESGTPCKKGPEVSHIFFVDDLLLFGEASFSQARLMEHILAEFCRISGAAYQPG